MKSLWDRHRVSVLLVVITALLYVGAFAVWDRFGSVRTTDPANQWLAGLVTLVLAIAAWLAWTFHDKRARYIELSEMFASVHAEITGPEVTEMMAAARPSEAQRQALRSTYLRNSARIEVIKQYEDRIVQGASARAGDVGASPFDKLFRLVEEALVALGDVVPDDEATAAQKVENSKTFKQDHTKSDDVQTTYSQLAHHLAGRPLARGESATVVAGAGLPFDTVLLSRGGQAVELSRAAPGGEREKVAWITGTGKGEQLGAETGHFGREDGPGGKRHACDLGKVATRRAVLARADELAGGPRPSGAQLGQALVDYFRSVRDLPESVTCPECRTLAATNKERP